MLSIQDNKKIDNIGSDKQIEYNKALFNCKLVKKKFIGRSSRYLYVFADSIIINKEQFKKKPDRML